MENITQFLGISFLVLGLGCGEAPRMQPRVSAEAGEKRSVASYRQDLAELAMGSVIRRAQSAPRSIDALPLTPDAMLKLAVAIKMVDRELNGAYSWSNVYKLIDGIPYTLGVGAMTSDYARGMDPERLNMIYLRERELLLLDERNLERLPSQAMAAGLIHMATGIQAEREIAQLGGYTPTEYRALLALCGNVMRRQLFVSHALAAQNVTQWFLVHRSYLHDMPDAILPVPFYHYLASVLSQSDRREEFALVLWRHVNRRETRDKPSKHPLCRFPISSITPWVTDLARFIPAE